MVRNVNYEVLSNLEVSLKLSIIEESPNGNYVYQEIHNVITSQIGLVNLNVGEGNILSGTFESIDWEIISF